MDNPFLILQTINPDIWPNIPRPLSLALTYVKECIEFNSTQISELILKINSEKLLTKNNFESINQTTTRLNQTIVDNSKEIYSCITNVTDEIKGDLVNYKNTSSKNFDFFQRSSETRMNKMQEELHRLKNIINNLSFKSETEELVKKSCMSLESLLKRDIEETFIRPQIIKIKAELADIKKNTDVYYAKFEETNEVNQANILSMSQQFNERLISFEKIINAYEENKKDQEKLRFNEFFQELNQNNQNELFENNEKIEYLAEAYKKLKQKFKGFNEKFTKIDKDLKKQADEIESANNKLEINSKLIEETKKNNQKNERKNSAKVNTEEKKLSKERTVRNDENDSARNEKRKNSLINNSERLKTEPKKLDEKPSEENLQRSPMRLSEEFESNAPPEKKIESLEKKLENFEKISKPIFRKKTFSIDASEYNQKAKLTKEPQIANQSLTFDDLLKVTLNLSENFKKFQENIFPLKDELKQQKSELEIITKELKEKLEWLPMNLNHISDKSPMDARIFTIESRLRNEENIRAEQFNKLLVLIHFVRAEFSSSNNSSVTEHLPKKIAKEKSFFKKRNSSDAVSHPYMMNNSVEFEKKSVASTFEISHQQEKPKNFSKLLQETENSLKIGTFIRRHGESSV